MNLRRLFETWRRYGWRDFRADARAGALLGLAAIPVTLALGVASGMGPAAAFYTATIMAFFAALFGGTRALWSGAAISLAVLTAVALREPGIGPAQMTLVVTMAGAFQILFAWTGIARFATYVPYSVLAGFFAGIAVILAESQLRLLLDAEARFDTLAVFGIALAVLLVWPRLVKTPFRGTAVALVAATLAAIGLFPGAERLGAMPQTLPAAVLAMPTSDFVLEAVGPALVIAAIASVQAVQHALSADSITGAQHAPNREVFGQGVGNVVGGMFGAMPGTANDATEISLRAGARTVVCRIVGCAVLAAVVLGLGRFSALIPIPAIAALLLVLAWRTVDWRFLRNLLEIPRGYGAAMLATAGLTASVDPLLGLAFGMVVAGLVRSARREQAEPDSVISTPLLDSTVTEDGEPPAARAGMLAFVGTVTLASSRKLMRILGDDIRQHEAVILDFTRTGSIDDSAAHVLATLADRAHANGTALIVLGPSEPVAAMLKAFGVLTHVPKGRMTDTSERARQQLADILRHKRPGGG
ncbi:MAG: SulP family inorganic anion transporter [Defluviicoccus sp.]|nr:SulP family inorganic anion transporter [Defluviicoccus sp.]